MVKGKWIVENITVIIGLHFRRCDLCDRYIRVRGFFTVNRKSLKNMGNAGDRSCAACLLSYTKYTQLLHIETRDTPFEIKERRTGLPSLTILLTEWWLTYWMYEMLKSKLFSLFTAVAFYILIEYEKMYAIYILISFKCSPFIKPL